MISRDELIVDSFAGGGGASLGIHLALGRSPDIAINHDPSAIAMHAANHPSTKHVLEDVWKADLKKLVGNRKVGLLWLSPDCKHFSRAKGGKPVEKKIRSLAWIACKWASQVRPRIICLENVREFADWGPLVPRLVCRACGWKGTAGQAILMRVNHKCPHCESKRLTKTEELVPCPKRKGLTFRRFVGRLRALGYKVEWKNLDAADFGAPTHRKRLFLVARRDGEPIVWPEATHASPSKLDDMPLSGRLEPYRTAAECIDWSIKCPSIFGRSKPLADKTMRRIALGIKRYVIDNPEPFIVQLAHGEGASGRWGMGSRPLTEPLGTVHAGGGNHALVTPIVSRYNGSKTENDDRCGQVGPLPTITTAHRGELGLAAATLVRQFGKSDAVDVDQPMPTTTAGGGGKTSIVTASLEQIEVSNDEIAAEYLAKRHGGGEFTPEQLAYIAKHYGGPRPGSPGSSADEPLPTTTASGTQNQVVAAYIAKHFGGMVGVGAERPLPTTTMRGTQNQLVTANLVHLNHGEKQWSGCDDPMRTVTTGNHAALVYSFMVKYFGTSIGANLLDPAPTATGKDRFGLVTVQVNDEPYVIVDIGMRMLTPRELARAQGFPDSYLLTGTKTSQVARIGNSVVPQVAAAIVAANCMSEVYQ